MTGRVLVVVAVSVLGGLGATAFALAWLLTGFMGTAVARWEPVAYPAGAVLCVLIPVLVGRRLLGRGGRRTGWGLAAAAGAAAVAVAVAVAVSVLGVG